MKRVSFALTASLLLFLAAAPSHGQMGMDFFKRSLIAKYFNPVVGKGAEYQTISKNGAADKTRTTVLGVVGKESVDGKEGFWLEGVNVDAKGQTSVSKMLFAREDMSIHKIIFQLHGMPATEMPYNPANTKKEKLEENLKDWHSVGTETVTVPGGTFVCEHLHNDQENSDIWLSDKLAPFGLVKHVTASETMVLSRNIPDFQEHITGPVKPFDPQAYKQMIMEEMQKKQNQ